MAGKKYLIVFKGLAVAVPKSLQHFVKKSIQDEFSQFDDLELDFSSSRAGHDLAVLFRDGIPGLPVFGESSRISTTDNSGTSLDSGDATIWVQQMRIFRLEITPGFCEPTFPETEAALGSLIANTAIHETGHMLGLDTGGFDGGGHTSDPDNYMWAETPTGDSTHVGKFFEYTVKKGDSLSAIVERYRRGLIDKCRVGASDLTYQLVWEDPENKSVGFIAHPTKSDVPGRRRNNPNWIYPGEKVALRNENLRTQKYRRNFPAFLGKKTFSTQQIQTIKAFIAQRLADGKG